MTVWGLDISTKCVAVAIVRDGRGPVFDTTPLKSHLKGAQRLHAAHKSMTLAVKTLKDPYPPDAVFVEMPAGKHVPPTLIHHVGVVLAALGGLRCPVVELTVSGWKELALGQGNASKEKILLWAIGEGYRGHSQDEADALGVAVAGCVLLNRELKVAA